jgi:hypothetical protein
MRERGKRGREIRKIWERLCPIKTVGIYCIKSLYRGLLRIFYHARHPIYHRGIMRMLRLQDNSVERHALRNNKKHSGKSVP